MRNHEAIAPASEITPRSLYLNRREFVTGGGASAVALAAIAPIEAASLEFGQST
jgi:hypothetical protein